jgi:DegV family protein with EDD domain
MERSVRLITDSVADIPQDLVRRYDIEVIPITITVGNKTYREDDNFDREWFYQTLSRRNGDLTTAAPPPQDFLHAYTSMAAEGAETVIGVFTAGSMSSICNHARIAASECVQAQVHVVDSLQISMGTGWLVLYAAECLERGRSVARVLEGLKEIRQRTLVLGVLNSLDYLQRSGRIGRVTRHMADLMKIKPLIAFELGEARLISRVRTYWKATERLVDQVTHSQPFTRLALLHSRAREAMISRLHAKLSSLSDQDEIPVIDVGAVFATHIGPGGLGVAMVQVPKAEGLA